MREGETVRERERKREKETETDRQTDRFNDSPLFNTVKVNAPATALATRKIPIITAMMTRLRLDLRLDLVLLLSNAYKGRPYFPSLRRSASGRKGKPSLSPIRSLGS